MRSLWRVLGSSYILLVLLSVSYSKITENDFFDFKTGTKLKENSIQIKASHKYPHWSNRDNQKISIVESGIIRFSGFDGQNTLDILVLATAQPVDAGGGIWYEEQVIPSQALKEKIKKELKDAKDISKFESFDPIGVILITWDNVEFYSGRKSSFQVLLATNGTRTISIIKIAIMRIPSWQLIFYPELDTRFAYDDGTKFKRSRFLQTTASKSNKVDVKSGTKTTHEAATSYSNSGKDGRWILDVTDNPDAARVTANKTVVLPAGVTPPNVNLTNIGVSGKFVFNILQLDGSQIVKLGDNSEINVILTKKDKDSRYNTLNQNILDWLSNVFYKASNSTPQQITIIDYKAGSLVVDYSVEMPPTTCTDRVRGACIKAVETGVRTVTKEPQVETKNMKGSIDETKTEFQDLDECAIDSERTDRLFCDVNAYCIDFPDQGSYACICKDDYEGNGKVGNCKKEKDKLGKVIPVVGGVGGAALALLIFIVAAIWYVKKKEEQRFYNRRMEAQRIIPRNMLPKQSKKRSLFKEKKSTRKMHVPAPYDVDFDIYHRT